MLLLLALVLVLPSLLPSLLSFLILFESVVRASGVEDGAPPLERRGSSLIPRSAKGEMGGRTQDGAVKGVRKGESDIALGRRVVLAGLLILRCPAGGTPMEETVWVLTVLFSMWSWVIGCKFCTPIGCWEILGCFDAEVGLLWRVVEDETVVNVDVVERGEEEGNVDDDVGEEDEIEGIFLRMSASPCPEVRCVVVFVVLIILVRATVILVSSPPWESTLLLL